MPFDFFRIPVWNSQLNQGYMILLKPKPRVKGKLSSKEGSGTGEAPTLPSRGKICSHVFGLIPVWMQQVEQARKSTLFRLSIMDMVRNYLCMLI